MRYVTRLLYVVMLALLTMNSPRAATDITTFTNDLHNLIIQGEQLVVTTSATTLIHFTMDSSLSSLDTSVDDYLVNVQAVYDSLNGSATLSLTDDSLLALQTLSSVVLSLSQGVLDLSIQLAELSSTSSLSALESSLQSMLRLSDDIGAMADRIGEMADRILIMADNIGVMADRIIATQLIQSTNLELLVNAMLETQTNTITLFSLFSL